MRIAGVLLAGGLGRRMGGGDKPLRRIGGTTILERVIARARPQVEALVLNANGDPARFAEFGLPVAADSIAGFAGPLAGVLAGLDWAAPQGFTHIASFATDAPFLPQDLVSRLAEAMTRERAELACAASGGRTHPVFGLWPAAVRDALRRALAEEGMRKIDRWTGRYTLAVAEWGTEKLDPFFNANEPEDLARAEALASAAGAGRRGDLD